MPRATPRTVSTTGNLRTGCHHGHGAFWGAMLPRARAVSHLAGEVCVNTAVEPNEFRNTVDYSALGAGSSRNGRSGGACALVDESVKPLDANDLADRWARVW